MTICIATNFYHPAVGGIPGYYKWLSEILVSFGHNVIILTVDEAGTGEDNIEKENGITRIVLRSSYKKHLDFYSNYFRPGSYSADKWISMGWAMREWLLENHLAFHIDIIETTDFGGAGIFLVDDNLPPVIVIGHSSAIQICAHSYMKNDDHLKVIRQLETLSFQYCAAIVTHSPMNQQELGKITKRDVQFGRAPWIAPATPPFSTQNEKIETLVVSSLQMIKGAAVMAEAVGIVAKKDSSFKLHWIGGDSFTAPNEEKVSSYLEKNYPDSWNKHFIWMGEKEHSVALNKIAEASLVILPSCWDTFNYTVIEAVFFEKPIIITENTGASYLFGKEKSMKKIPANAPDELAVALLERAELLKESEKERKGIKERVIEYFSPSNIMKDRLDLYAVATSDRKKYGNEVSESLSFINNYTTLSRKYYFKARKTAKNILKRKT